jgi:hypothetical protein
VVKKFEFAAKNPLASILKECVQRELNMVPKPENDCTNSLIEKFMVCNSKIDKMSKEYRDLTNQMGNGYVDILYGVATCWDDTHKQRCRDHSDCELRHFCRPNLHSIEGNKRLG